MNLLLLDIESSPNKAFVWGVFKENIPLARLIDSSSILCFSAKWYGTEHILFDSIHKSSKKQLLKRIHKLLDDADAVITYNGNRFDLPVLNKEFLLAGMTPPAPYKSIDLYQTVKRQFRFTSNKLDYVTQQLGLGKKVETDFSLWVKCMNKDSEAWEQMENYNKNDVLLLEKAYTKILPWITKHPNHGLYVDSPAVCPSCGGNHFHRRGYVYTSATKYPRYCCQSCGTWFRGAKSEGPKPGEKFVNV